MTNRRRALAGLAMVAAVGLATAGCGTDSSGSLATPASAPDPRQTLVDSVRGLAEGNFTFTMTDNESTGSGSVHAPSKSAQFEAKSKPDAEDKMTIGLILIDQDRWIKLDLGPEVGELLKLPNKWMHIDPAKVKDSEVLKEMSVDFGNADEIDPAGAATIFKGLATAEQTGEGAYSGTVDLTKATDAGMVDEDVVAKLADKAKSVPFTATLDGQGRITKLTLSIPAAGEVSAHPLEVTYSDYGAATAAQPPPAGQTQEAPASAYKFLNN